MHHGPHRRQIVSLGEGGVQRVVAGRATLNVLNPTNVRTRARLYTKTQEDQRRN